MEAERGGAERVRMALELPSIEVGRRGWRLGWVPAWDIA